LGFLGTPEIVNSNAESAKAPSNNIDATNWYFIVLGSAAGALTATLIAAKSGLKILMLEKTPYLGGSAALSGGMKWIPNNAHLRAAGHRRQPRAGVEICRELYRTL
jgi:3-oxosteroid 1-dehydrogenase